MDRFITWVLTASYCSAGTLCSYASSSCSPSSGVLSSLRSAFLKSILATPIVFIIKTNNCTIIDLSAKEINKKDSDSYKATNRKLILKNSC